ncbi:acyltransferase family protein [Flavobacterium aciduliphilum]|nr:acyltransferase [Flavobacterium aciduliphilum]
MNSNNCFDFLRFFFAINIVLSHLWQLSQSKSLFFLSYISDSGIAVKGFFVISGFLVAKSYITTPSLKFYFLKRAKRILPAYIFVVLISVVGLSFFSNHTVFDYFTTSNTYSYLGWNLIFLNFVHPCLPGLFENNLMCAVNGALWTIKVEEGFYLILPFIFYSITKLKRATLVLFLIYIGSLLYWYLMDSYLQKPLLAKQLPGYLCYFVVGIFLFLNFDRLQHYKLRFFLVATALFLVSFFSQIKIDFFYPAAFGIIVIVSAYSLPFFNAFGKYGDFTYGIYIFHFPLIQLFRQYNLFEKHNPYFVAIVLLFVLFVAAVFSWFVVEKRFLDRYKIAVKAIST